MCGVCGFVGHIENGQNLLVSLNAAQAHRGPDSSGIFISPESRVGLGMTRLSIMDLNSGNQPMSIDNGRFVIVFNGEIFNAPELRAGLEQKFGEQFNSISSDTEVIVRLFKYHGVDCFSMLNGMFALAIYSAEENCLVIARDYMGIKPIFFTRCYDRILFTSELQAISKNSNVDLTLDKIAISEFLDLGYINAPRTIYSSIRRLLPGHFLKINCKNLETICEPWTSQNVTNSMDSYSIDDLHKSIRDELIRSLQRWTLSDVPVCYSLSGGLDSSTLASIASSKSRIETFTVGFESNDFCDWDETKVARKISDDIGSNHNEIKLDLVNFESDLEEMLEIFSEPYAGGVPSYYLFKNVSARGYKTIITGVGGDELFGNYSRAHKYSVEYGSDKVFDVASYIDLIYGKKLKTGFELRSEDLQKSNAYLDQQPFSDFRTCGTLAENVYSFDTTTQLPNEFLSMTDVLSMRFSVEARTPFLDKEFIKLMRTVPWQIKSTPNNYKNLLVKSLAGYVPKNALGQKKRGFSLPLSYLMRSQLKRRFEKLMSKKALHSCGFFDEQIYNNLVAPFLAGDNEDISLVWRVFLLQLWLSKRA